MKDMNLKTEIKVALAKNGMTQQSLVKRLQSEYNVKITESGLSQKLTNETLRFQSYSDMNNDFGMTSIKSLRALTRSLSVMIYFFGFTSI